MRKKSTNKISESIDSLEVRLWGMAVGYLALGPNGISFEYEEEFKKSGLEISPLEMPLASTTIYTSNHLGATFKGLPGIFADCLPDNYGQKIIDNYFFQNHGIISGQVNPLMSLAYLNNRAMGALEFFPNFTQDKKHDDVLSLANLVDAAKKTLQGKADVIAAEIMRVSASAGGMKAKVSVDFNPDTFEIRSGFSSAKAGFIPCLIKFDGVLDGEMAGYYGKLEYVYNLVAADCGIEVPRSFLIESKSLDQSPAYHFVVERFDRDENKAKAVHVASYCGLGLSDFRRKNSSSYENLLRTIKGLCAADVREVEKGLRRCIFNLIMRNEDDHPKNFSFLMDQKGSWMLAPAYDLNYVKVSGGHQMSLNQKNENFLLKDILFLARSVDIKETKARHIIEEVTTSAKKFLNFADEVALDEDFATGVMGNFNWYL